MTAITTVAVSSTHTTLTTAFCYYFATVLLTLQTGRVHCSAFAGVSASFITPTFSVRSSSADGARTRRGICSSTSNYRVILPLVNSKVVRLITLLFLFYIYHTHTHAYTHAHIHAHTHTHTHIAISISFFDIKDQSHKLYISKRCVIAVV